MKSQNVSGRPNLIFRNYNQTAENVWQAAEKHILAFLTCYQKCMFMELGTFELANAELGYPTLFVSGSKFPQISIEQIG